MKKLFIIITMCFLLLGCESNNKKEEINKYILNSSYEEISTKLDEIINTISYFPSKESEHEYIYYVKGIIDNLDKFNDVQKDELYKKLNDLNYNFMFNSLEYTVEKYQNDISLINNWHKIWFMLRYFYIQVDGKVVDYKLLKREFLVGGKE